MCASFMESDPLICMESDPNGTYIRDKHLK